MRIGAVATVSLVALTACATRQPVTGRPPIPPEVARENLHFADAQVAVGDVAPDFTLPAPDGFDEVTLSSLRGRPVVLVFGSHT